MKKLTLFLLALLAASAAFAQPKMELAHLTHAFGAVSERGGKVSHAFPFTNTGDKPLVILRLDTSCGCISAAYPKRPVAPGATGEIAITYDPRHQSGTFLKAIPIITNDAEGRHIISVQGRIVK